MLHSWIFDRAVWKHACSVRLFVRPMKWEFSMWKTEGSRTVYSRKWDVRHVLRVPRAMTLAAVPWPGLEMPASLSCSAPATHSVSFGLKAEAEALSHGIFPRQWRLPSPAANDPYVQSHSHGPCRC